MEFPGFVGPAYEARSVRADSQKLINLYPERNEIGGKWTLYGTPGLANFCTGLAGAVRCLYAGENRLFAVAGDKLYEISSAGVATVLGTVTDDGRRAYIMLNGTQLCVVSGGGVWIATGAPMGLSGDFIEQTFYDGGWSGTLDQFHQDLTWKSGDKFDVSWPTGKSIVIGGITKTIWSVTSDTIAKVYPADSEPVLVSNAAYSVAGDALAASAGAYIDTYFIVSMPASEKFYISAPGNGLSWSALDFGSAEGYPDHLATLAAANEDLYLIGTETVEPWRDTGNADFPFEPIPGATLAIGTPAPDATVTLGAGIALLAGNRDGGPIAHHILGYQPKRISTHALEYEWSTYSSVADAQGFSYTENGHEFWQINFPAANKTWVYDASTATWHQRAYGADLDRHKARCHAFVFGKHLVGDHTAGTIYRMSSELLDDAGTGITRVRRAPHVSDNLKRIFTSEFELNLDPGTTVTLSWSNDGGVNWNTPRPPSGFRIANAYPALKLAQIWRRLGSARDRVYEAVITGEARVAIFGAFLRTDSGK